MYSNFCYSDGHLELLGIKALTDSIIQLVDRADRPKLYRARKSFFLLCDEVGQLFDKIEWVERWTDSEEKLRSLRTFRSVLYGDVTGPRSVIRLMAYSFNEILHSDVVLLIEDQYQILLNDIVEATKEASNTLEQLKDGLETYLKNRMDDVDA